MKIKKDGFVLIETIVIICILCVSLLSLYRTYSNVAANINNTNLNDSVENTYLAKNAYKFFTLSNLAQSYSYVEIEMTLDAPIIRGCQTSGGSVTCQTLNQTLSYETIDAYDTLNIKKIYYTTKQFTEIIDDKTKGSNISCGTNCGKSMLLTFDGRTINYLRSIKNKALSDAEEVNYNFIIKTKDNTFGYIQG